MKKGLSPLIATVLLIGITISLAALVMVWGQALFKQTTEETGKSAQAEINCISKVQVDILNASCVGLGGPGGSPMNIIVDNKNEEPVHGFIVRMYEVGGNVETITVSPSGGYNLPLDSFNARTYAVPFTLTNGITKVDVIPQIKLDDGTLRACGQKIDTFTLISPNLIGGCS